MNCPNCNSQCNNDEVYCRNCGCKLDEQIDIGKDIRKKKFFIIILFVSIIIFLILSIVFSVKAYNQYNEDTQLYLHRFTAGDTDCKIRTHYSSGTIFIDFETEEKIEFWQERANYKNSKDDYNSIPLVKLSINPLKDNLVLTNSYDNTSFIEGHYLAVHYQLNNETVKQYVKLKQMIKNGNFAITTDDYISLDSKVREKVKKSYYYENINKIESANTTTLYGNENQIDNSQILNKKFHLISPTLREYLAYIAKEFDRNWDKTIIRTYDDKNYTTTVVFTINKGGLIDEKRIISKSSNDSLDDSVSYALKNISNVDVPPNDYNGEQIYITFNYDNKANTYIKYPDMRNKE